MTNHKKNLIIIPVVFLLVASVAFFFIYHDMWAKNSSAESTLAQWQSDYSSREEIRSLNESMKAIAPQKAQLETHFVQSADVVPFLNTIESLGTEANVQASIVSVAISQDQTPSLLVDVSSSGSFVSTYDFLMLLENSPYEIEIDSVDMLKASTLDASGKTLKAPEWKGDFKIKLLSFIQ